VPPTPVVGFLTARSSCLGAQQPDVADPASWPPHITVGREDDSIGALGDGQDERAGDWARGEVDVAGTP
jgi:hypothetical protein